MVPSLALILAALVMLYFGGDALIRGATALAARLGVSSLVIGLTVVAFGTSAPELVVSVDAALVGAIDISVGNVVGSNIANIGLILGLSALLRPTAIAARLVRIDSPLMVLVSLALAAVLSNGVATRVEGGLLLAGLLTYVAFTFTEARREAPPVREQLASAAPRAPARVWVGAALVIAGLAMLVAGGHLLVVAAVDIASALGVSEAVIGLTIVAIGTSLPELAVSVLAAWRGQGDIAVGNVIGSNIFNILGIIGITAVIRPLAMGSITFVDLAAMVAFACVLTVFLATRRRLERVEGALLLLAFVGYTGWLLLV